MPSRTVFGWDIGGAHVKACMLQDGELIDVAQWACPLWLGMDRLSTVLQSAHERWAMPPGAQHAVTMTGEMVDLFADRAEGVHRIAVELSRGLGTPLHFFAGDAGWCREAEVPDRWDAIASANWLATARHAAQHFSHGLLADIGSTTTDLIAFTHGRVASPSRSDAQRLASGELIYHGVVRTPLCAVTQRIDWHGTTHLVMNEFFATSADVYRLTGELDPAHDLHPSADNAPKSPDATRQRLARMIGLDQRDGSSAEWLDFARRWRTAQVAVLARELRRVMADHALTSDAVIVSAGCGDFLLDDVVASACEAAPAPRRATYGSDVARVSAQAAGGRATVEGWAQVCAPSVAVASLFSMD